jgi:hypothetical protein
VEDDFDGDWHKKSSHALDAIEWSVPKDHQAKEAPFITRRMQRQNIFLPSMEFPPQILVAGLGVTTSLIGMVCRRHGSRSW